MLKRRKQWNEFEMDEIDEMNDLKSLIIDISYRSIEDVLLYDKTF